MSISMALSTTNSCIPFTILQITLLFILRIYAWKDVCEWSVKVREPICPRFNKSRPSENIFLEIKLDCDSNEITSEVFSRSLSLTGTSPQVTIINSIPQTKITLTGVISHSRPPRSKSNETFWLVPVPMLQGISVATVIVHSIGMGYLPLTSKTTVILKPKMCRPHSTTECKIHFPVFITTLTKGQKEEFLEKLKNSEPKMARFENRRSVDISLASEHSIIITTTDHFRHVHYFQLKTKEAPAKEVCPSEGIEINVTSIVTMGDVFLAVTNYGLLEFPVMQPGKSQRCGSASVRMDECIKFIRFNWNAYKKKRVLVLVDMDSKVYYSIKDNRYDATHFSELQDKDKQNLCLSSAELQGSEKCDILDVAITDVLTEIKFLFLVRTSLKNITTYFLYTYKGSFEEGHWLKLYALPTNLCYDDLHGSTDFEDLNKCNSTFSLSNVTFTNIPTVDFYIFGDIIIHGKSDVNDVLILIHNYKEKKNILVFTTSYEGEFAFLTEDLQLWVGNIGIQEVSRVRPSSGWDIMLSLLVEKPKIVNTLTIDYDETGNLYEVVLEEKDGKLLIKRNVLQVGDILVHEAYRKHWNIETKQETCEAHHECAKCQFDSLLFIVTNAQFYKRERFYILPAPTSTLPLGNDNDDALSAYHNIVKRLTVDHIKYSAEKTYSSLDYDFMKGWKKKMEKQDLQNWYKYTTNGSQFPVFLSPEQYKMVYDQGTKTVKELPETIYLDKGQVFNITVSLIKPAEEPEDKKMLLVIDISNEVILKASITKTMSLNHEVQLGKSTNYEVQLISSREINSTSTPGTKLRVVSVLFYILKSSYNCFEETSAGYKPVGTYRMSVMIGCPPLYKILFDWKETQRRTHGFLDKDTAALYDCVNARPEKPCFYFRKVFYPSFLLVDYVTDKVMRFKGDYTFKIIGGGYNDQIHNFSDSEVVEYNKKANMWQALHQAYSDPTPVFNYKRNGIRWICDTETPCSHAYAPYTLNELPVYTFIIQISTSDHEIASPANSYCEFNLVFEVRVHGIPLGIIGLQGSILIMMLTSAVVTAILLIASACMHYNLYTWLKVQILGNDSPKTETPRTSQDTSLPLLEKKEKWMDLTKEGHLKMDRSPELGLKKRTSPVQMVPSILSLLEEDIAATSHLQSPGMKEKESKLETEDDANDSDSIEIKEVVMHYDSGEDFNAAPTEIEGFNKDLKNSKAEDAKKLETQLSEVSFASLGSQESFATVKSQSSQDSFVHLESTDFKEANKIEQQHIKK